MLVRLDRLTRMATQGVAILSILLVLAAALLTVLDVFMRSVVGQPLFGTNDLVILLLTVAVTGCFPYALAIRQHIQVTLLGQALGGRAYWLLELLAALLTLAVFVGFTIAFARRAGYLGATDAGTQLLQIPLMPVWWAAAAILALATLTQAVVLIRCAYALVRGAPAATDGSGGSP